MMDKNSDKKQVEIIKHQIDEVIKNLESIKNQTSNIQSASELIEFEKAIAKETDKLAGLLTAKTIQESLDSECDGRLGTDPPTADRRPPTADRRPPTTDPSVRRSKKF